MLSAEQPALFSGTLCAASLASWTVWRARTRTASGTAKPTWILLAVLAAGMLLAAACTDGGDAAPDVAQPGSGVSVLTGRLDGSAGEVLAAIGAELLGELGYEVSAARNDGYRAAAGYEALAEGEVDIWFDGYYPADRQWHEMALADGSPVANHVVVLDESVTGTVVEGLLITRGVVDEYRIGSLGDVNDSPQLVALFDTDGNGKANVFGCPDDLACGDVIDAVIANNGWDNLEQTRSWYQGLLAESGYRVDDGDPAIQYARVPSWAEARLALGDNTVWLDLGGPDHACPDAESCDVDWPSAGAEPVPDSAPCTAAPCHTGWNPSTLQLTVNAEFASANPAAMRLLELLRVDPTDLAELHLRAEEAEDPEAAAELLAAEWVAANRELATEWVVAASTAG